MRYHVCHAGRSANRNLFAVSSDALPADDVAEPIAFWYSPPSHCLDHTIIYCRLLPITKSCHDILTAFVWDVFASLLASMSSTDPDRVRSMICQSITMVAYGLMMLSQLQARLGRDFTGNLDVN